MLPRRSPQPPSTTQATHVMEFGVVWSRGSVFGLRFGLSLKTELKKVNRDMQALKSTWQIRLQETFNDPSLTVISLREGSLIVVCRTAAPLLPIVKRISSAFDPSSSSSEKNKKLLPLEGISLGWNEVATTAQQQWFKLKDLPVVERLLTLAPSQSPPPPPMMITGPQPLLLPSPSTLPPQTPVIDDSMIVDSAHVLTSDELHAYITYANGCSGSQMVAPSPRELERQRFEQYLQSQNLLEQFKQVPGWEDDWYEVAAQIAPRLGDSVPWRVQNE